jgi:hypothetical protein
MPSRFTKAVVLILICLCLYGCRQEDIQLASTIPVADTTELECVVQVKNETDFILYVLYELYTRNEYAGVVAPTRTLEFKESCQDPSVINVIVLPDDTTHKLRSTGQPAAMYAGVLTPDTFRVTVR